jgi:hypothetical protein
MYRCFCLGRASVRQPSDGNTSNTQTITMTANAGDSRGGTIVVGAAISNSDRIHYRMNRKRTRLVVVVPLVSAITPPLFFFFISPPGKEILGPKGAQLQTPQPTVTVCNALHGISSSSSMANIQSFPIPLLLLRVE